jgi:ribonuclease BN (tRNA processing enzyme)
MKIQILGCYGGELGGDFNTVSFLINESLVLDAGAITSTLNLRQQAKITDILISHSHLDHIKDIPFLAANMVGITNKTINIISTEAILTYIKAHLFNDAIWPDFAMLPTPDAPILKFQRIPTNQDIQLRDIIVRAIRVNHLVDAVGYIIKDKTSAIVYTGDTGPTDEIWKESNHEKNLKAIFVETSFPNRMKKLADDSGHLTPSGLKGELQKIHNGYPDIFILHIKPQYVQEIEAEIQQIGNPNIHILKQKDTFQF